MSNETETPTSDAVEMRIREAALDAAIAELQAAGAESGEAILQKLDQDVDGQATVQESFTTDRSSVDTATVYSVVDGTPSVVLLNMLSKILRRRIPADAEIPARFHGKRAFALRPPTNIPPRQQLKCWLHPEHPMREFLDEIGLTGVTCRKHNIPSEFEVRNHVQFKHKRTWAAIQTERSERRDAESRDLQRQQAESMTVLARELRDALMSGANATSKKASLEKPS